jgi:hypothetical protein
VALHFGGPQLVEKPQARIETREVLVREGDHLEAPRIVVIGEIVVH